jgi:hypothetical protein
MLENTKAVRSAADRMRAYRRRRRRGLRFVKVQVGWPELDGLVANGYLPADKVQDLLSIELAVNDLFSIGFNRPGDLRYV